MSGILEAALTYAARGWHVFALSGRKTPFANCERCRTEHTTPEAMEACRCLHCHGFYAATTDADRITAMFSTDRHVCLAIRTGAVSGMAVVDVDIRTWRTDGTPDPADTGMVSLTALDEQRLLPGTVMAETAGGGLHLFYAHPGGYLMSGAGKYGPGIDSKADGGYVVAAPSVDARGRAYRWTPADPGEHALTPLHPELVERLRPPAPITRPAVVAPPTAATSHNRFRALVHKVLTAQEGNRNQMLHWAAKATGEMIATGEMSEQAAVAALQDAAYAIGLSASEVGDTARGTIGSGLRRGRNTLAVVA